MAEKNGSLKLEDQLCFPLYACSKEIVKKYKPFLDELNLTYTQYITMMVLWEEKAISVKQLGEKLLLDSGTLTPVLKTLEKKDYVTRARSKEDERVLIVSVTSKGMELKDLAADVPKKVFQGIHLSSQESEQLYDLLQALLKEVS